MKNFDTTKASAIAMTLVALLYVHCVEALYNQASRKVHGHFPESGEEVHHDKE